MTTVLSASGIELPDAGDPHSRAQINRNFTKVDTLWQDEAKRAMGIIASADQTNPGSGTALFIVNNIGSVTFKANRWYEVIGTGGLKSSVANATPIAHLYTCSTADGAAVTTGLTEIMGYNTPQIQGSGTQRFSARRFIKYTADTTLQIKLGIQPINSDTVTLDCGATYPCQLTIVDHGMNF